MKQISVVIPTLQKNVEILKNLIKSLESDNAVSEIILIDNSCKGFALDCTKLRVITPQENLFVNPSWNLGVREAKEEIVALLNDDITIPCDFCSRVVEKMSPEMGIVGFRKDFVDNIPQVMPIPELTELTLEKANVRCEYFGIAMFFYKSSYIEIPEDIKIFWGDDWIYYKNEKKKRKNYFITNQKIYHWGSLTSAAKEANPYEEKDKVLYKRYTRKWHQYILSYRPEPNGFRMTILGIDIKYHWDKKNEGRI